jgi:hypothetical protein
MNSIYFKSIKEKTDKYYKKLFIIFKHKKQINVKTHTINNISNINEEILFPPYY